MTGGGIAWIDCPPSDGANPFVGDVRFTNVFFPFSQRQSSLFESSQGYRNLRSHLDKLDNALESEKLRCLQLRADREREKGFAWFVNWFYGTFAGYGRNPGRPLLYLLGLYLVTVFAVYKYDGGI